MLGKLMKHEWKSVYKIGCILVGAVLALTLLGVIAFQLPPVRAMFANDSIWQGNEMMDIVGAMSMMASFVLYILTLTGAMYGIYIYLAVHFYKTMYTDEGYLTHTLPVNAHQILISKTLIAGFWNILVTLALFISVFALMISFIGALLSGVAPELTWTEVWNEVGIVFEEIMNEAGDVFVHYIVVLILMMIISPFCAMMTIFGAITIGQLSKKYKVLMSILAYIGISTVNGIISFIIEMIQAVTMNIGMSEEVPFAYMLGTYDASLIQMILMAVGLYFLSHFIITKKLNLE